MFSKGTQWEPRGGRGNKMQLTDEEQRMYHGEYGTVVAQAMDYLVKLGEACDSDSMVDISYAHVNPGGAFFYNDVEEILELAEAGARVVVPTTTTVVATDMEEWQTIGSPEAFAQRQLSVITAHKKMGIVGTYSCTPYIMGYLPPKGAHIASIESSAVIYFNSMLGARSNKDGPFAIYAALTGKYPACGYHLNENRKGTHLIQVDAKLNSPTDYGALGFYIGEMVGEGVPVITGLKSPRQEELIAMGTAMATSGQVALYHIPGVTAECAILEDVFIKGASYDEFSIDTNDIRKTYEKLYTAKSDIVDFVYLGCPHYTLEQVRQVCVLIMGGKVHRDVKFWIATNRATKAVADRMGYSGVIKDAGGLVVCDCCGLGSHLRKIVCRDYNLTVPAVSNMITDSVKQAKYANDTIGCTTIVAKLEDCIEAAVTGKGIV
jgi:predicted aconitase